MSTNKTKDSKINHLGSITNKQTTSSENSSSSDSIQGKIVHIRQASEKKKIEFINQVIKSAPSF